MSAFDDFLKKYGKNASKQAEQDKLRNDFDSWLKNNSKNSHSGADTVQPPAGTQIGGYKSQNAAHLSSGLSRDDFDSSARNRNQYLDLEKSIDRDRVNKINADKVMTVLNSRPGMTDTDPINTPALVKNEKVSLGNDKPDIDIPYYEYNSNRPETVIKAIDYSESTGKALESLKAKIDSGSSWIKYYESSVNRYADRLERLAGEMQRNPTAANYREYNSLYAEYQKAYAEYENQISEYNSYTQLYNDYAKRYGTATALIQEYNEQWQKSNKDFFEKSETGTTAFEADKRAQEKKMLDDIQAQNNRPWWQKLLDAWTETRHYKYAGERELIGESIQQQADYYRSDTSYKEPSDKWTESEKLVFGYLYSTDPEKAGEFATMINNIDNREKTDKQKKAIADWTTKNFGTGLGGTLAALILSPTAIADYADNIAEYLGRGQITEKNHLSPFDVSQAFTGGISEELNEWSGTIDKSVPIFGGKGLGDIYSLGYSVAQSMSVGSLNFAPATLLYFFGQAAASGVDEKLAAGGSAEQALGFGFVAGAAEAICENIGIEHLFGSNSKNLLTAWLKQSGVEATEEGITSIINTVADGLIMMDKSQFATAVNEYQKFMSKEEAEKLALNDIIGAIMFDTVGGFVSGGADTVILAGANKVGDTVRTEKAKSGLEQTIKNADAVIGAYAEAVQKYGENSPQAIELKSKSERAYIEKVRANLRLGMLNGKSTTVTTQERSEEEITKLVTQAQSAGDATAETGYYAGASDQLIKFAQQEKAILKQLTGRNVDIRFYQADIGENGHYDPETGTIYVNVNSERPFSYIEGHEFTHELENSAGYAEYAEWVKTEGLGAMYNTYKENIKRRYESRGINLTELELEQEVVATWTGENLFTDDTTMKKLIKKLSDGKPTLARKIFGGIRRFVSRSRSGITRNHYERALYLYQQMAQGKASAVSSAQTVNENAPTSFPAETAKVPQKQKNTAEAVNTAENDIMISNGEAVAQDNGKITNDSEFTPAVRELVDRIADTARQIEASDQKGADYRRLKKEQKANLRALEQLRRDGKIDSVEYNRAIEALRDTTEGPEYGGIEESKANLQAQFEAGEIALEDYESAMAELEEVGAEENNGVKYSLADIDGNPIDEARISRNKVDIKYSLNHNPEIAQGQQDYLKSHNAAISMKELTEAQRITNAMVDVMMKYSSILPEDKIGKVLTKNGSYDRSVENTTICIRTLAYNEFVDKVQEEVGRPLTQMESFLVSQKLYDIATDPQCLYCYVSLDRKAFNDMLLRYMQDRDSVIAKYNNSDKSDEAVKQLYEDFLNGRKDTKNMKERFNKWLSYVDNGTQLLSLADIATEDRQSVIKADGGILAEQLKDARAYAQSASWSKIQKAYVAYRDEILKLGDKVVKSLNEHYGLRWYSFSDYSPAFIVENMQQITDASIRGLKGLSYTKDTDYAEIFAPSGMNINVSVFVNQDANGNFFIDEKQSANFEKALELRERYPNVGIVATVTNDEALRWAGEQEWSDVIIPFHIVRTGTDVAEYYKWLNYTAESADSVKDADMWNAYLDSLNLSSENARKKVSKNIYPNEHKNDKATYLNLCESRGLSPRFARFAGEDWYMKLVNETRLSADETPSLKPIYNEDAAKESFRKFVEKGGYEGGWYRENVDVDAEIKEVAQDVLAGKKANEVSYGRQDGYSPENLISGRKTNRNHGYRFSLEAPTREEVIGELRQYMSGARSKDQIRDVIARVKKNPQSEIYGGPARRPQYSEGVQRILADAEREGMSVRNYISQNIDEFEVRGKLTEDARKALEISGDYRKFSVEDVRANRPPRSIEELDRILAEAEPLDPNEFRKTDFDRWYERREKEDQLREKMGELVMKAPDENEINTTLEELASDLENGYITPDAALEVVEGLREETDGARVKYSLEKYTEHQKENWANSKRIVIYENDAQFTQFIENSVSDKTFDKKMYFGAISPELARRIQNDTGINVEHYNLSLGSYEIRKILKDHGDSKSEMSRGQRAVTADDFLHILDVVLNPSNIKLSDNTYAGKPVIIFTGTYNGRMNITAVVSDKRLDLFVQTIYVNTKRENLATPIGEQAPINTPEANSGTVFSGDIVPQDPEVVKPAVKKSVEDVDVPTADTIENLRSELETATAERDAIMAEGERLMDEVNQGAVSLEEYTERITESGQRYADLQSKIDRLTQQIESVEITEKAIGDPLQSAPLKRLVTTLGKRLNLKKVEKQALRNLIQDFATGEYATKEALYEAVKEGFDTFYYTERNELVAEIKAAIRNTPIKVSDAIKFDAEWTSDGFGKFVKSNFGKLRFSSTGRGVDSVYSELNGLYPDYFPDDIFGEWDMLQKISRVASLPINQVRAEPLGDEMMQDITDFIYESVLEYRESERADEERMRIKNEQEAIEKLECLKNLQSRAFRLENYKLTEEDKNLAFQILCGEKNLSEVDNAQNKEPLLEYIAVLNEAEVVTKEWKNWQKERRSEIQNEADRMFELFDNSVKGGVTLDKKGNAKLKKDGTDRAGYKYARETQTRITYDIFSEDNYDKAKAFNDWLFAPERASEAQSNRYKNKMRDRVRDLKLSTKIKKGDQVSESAAVQILGEMQDIVRRTKRQADMGNAETYQVNGCTYAGAVFAIEMLKKQNPSLDFSPNGKIQNAIKEFTEIYAELLADMNRALVRNGYPPVPARSGYFPHFKLEGDTTIRKIGRALGIDTDISVLPTGINGLTHTFKPGKTWFANALKRKGPKTEYDAVLGFDKYIEGAANVIFHTDNIQRQRAFARSIRRAASDENIQAQIDALIESESIPEEVKDLQIQYLSSQAKFRHSAYVVQLEDHTNSLAGKKTFSDRDMEKLLGRKAYTWMKNIEGRVAANMIAGNLSSALSNFIPLQYCKAEIGEWQTLRAMAETLRSFARDDGFVDRSDFLTNRYGSEFLVKSGIDKVSEKLSIPMEAIDHFTAQVLVRAAYNKYLKKGTSPELAMERANSFAAGVMADRSRGALPEIFNNKNPLYKSFTMFQVEVNNNLSHIFKDIPREYRDENKAKWIGAVAWILAKLFFGIWIFNETSEKIVGRRMAGTDVVDAANEVAGDLSGYRLPNTWDLIEAIFKGEDISAMFEANRVGAGQAILNLGETAAEDVPFVSSLFGGGDLPVGSALPDLSTILPLIGSEKDGENIKQTLIEEGLKPVSYALLPFGANQASKIHKGISALAKGGSYKTNSKGEEILQYPIYSDNIVETAWDHLRVFAFGKSATDQSREWVDSGFKSLSARGTAAYKGMIAAGVDEGDAHSLIIDIMSVEPTDKEIKEKIVSMGGVDRVFSEDVSKDVSNGPTSTDLKCEIIRNADISGEGKAILYFAMIANESECRFISSMQEAGADMSAVVEEMLDRNAEAKDRKLTAVTSSGLSEDEQLWQIYLLDTSSEKSTHKRYYVASDTFGISASEYRVANKFLTDYLDGNSRTQERVTAAIREYAQTVPLTKTEKAVLWQLLSNSTSAKNNPFDVRTGERVLTAINNYDREEEEFYAKYGPQPQ